MFIKEYEIFIYDLDRYYNLHSTVEQKSNYIAYFLFDAFLDIKRIGITIFIKELNNFNKDGIQFELMDINVDQIQNTVYISQPYNSYRDANIDNSINSIELCKKHIIKYSVMTKDNFIHLLLAWDKIVDQLPPFALLYLDDQNWYDVLPFDSQQAMEKFVADHTKIKHVEK